MSVTFKLVLKNENVDKEPHIRRIALPSNNANDDTLSLGSLRAHAKRLFSLRDDIVWYFKWQDEEGDLVTITEEYEFEDVVQAKALSFDGGIVRLNIFAESPPPEPSFPVHMMAFPSYPRFFCKQPNEGTGRSKVPTHEFGALCDVTNAQLRMNEGNWYHQLGTSTDICVEEFSKLSEADQQLFVHITKPSDLGADQVRYQLGSKCVDTPSSSSTSPAPTSSSRCKRGPCHQNTRAPFCGPFGRPPWCQKTAQQQGPCFGNSQIAIDDLMFIGWCDVTKSMLVSGQGWYHKRNTTYDLCKEEFDKLNASEKKQFVHVEKAADLGAEQHHYSTLDKVGNMFEHMLQEVHRATETPATTPHNQQSSWFEPGDAAQACSSSSSTSSTVPLAASVPSAPSVSPKKSMKIVSGPSIADKTNVEPGSHLIPVWEVENTGASLWTDVRVKPHEHDANVLQVNPDGFEVPVLGAGERGIVSVDFVVPNHLPGDKLVESVFELMDADGNNFGEQLKLKLHVMPNKDNTASQPASPVMENERELVALLGDMGFGNQAVCIRVLREHKGDVNAAALALLRAQSNQAL